MRMWVLGSGSRGNSVLIEAAGSRILIDAGFAPQLLIERMRAADVAPESIGAVVVTHEHVDHVRGVRALARKFGWAAYATQGTITAAKDLREAGAIPFRAGETFAIGEFDLLAVRAPHDAAEPVVFVVTARRTGVRAAVVYDLGALTQPLTEAMRGLDLLVLEANHDEMMLQNGPYPPSVRARIAGRNGHLCNRVAGELVREVSHKGLRHIVLAHLSESCNSATTALRDVGAGVRCGRFAGRMTVAPQDAVIGPFEPGARRSAALQLDFGL
ncbi:MAG: MBL fold metallo-hydrolase [Gemmatimonadaceae bacterium]